MKNKNKIASKTYILYINILNKETHNSTNNKIAMRLISILLH